MIRRLHPNMDKVIYYPEFMKIFGRCKSIMIAKFILYKNSWINFGDMKFWKRRLEREVDEIWKAKNKEDYKKEICDVINVLAMMYENAESYEPPKKRKKK